MQSGQPTPMPLNVPVQLTIQPQVQATPSPTPSPPQSWTYQTFGEDFVAFLIILAFIAVVIVTAIKKEWDANAVRIISVTSIVFIGVFSALTVANERNAAAVFALLGTIAGYILGRSERRDSKKQEDSTNPVETASPNEGASR